MRLAFLRTLQRDKSTEPVAVSDTSSKTELHADGVLLLQIDSLASVNMRLDFANFHLGFICKEKDSPNSDYFFQIKP